MVQGRQTTKGHRGYAQARAAAVGRHTRIRYQLLLLVAAVVAPLSGLLAYTLYADSQRDLRQAHVLLLGLTRTTAWHIHESLEHIEKQLAQLAEAPAIRTFAPGHCRLLADYLQGHPAVSNIVTLDRAGNVLCSANPAQRTTPTSYARAAWFERSLREDALVVGKAAPEPHPGLSIYAYPLHDGAGKTRGVIAFAVDFASYLAHVTATTVPETGAPNSDYAARSPLLQGVVYWVIDENGQAIARFPAGNGDRPGVQWVEPPPTRRHEPAASLDANGVETVYGQAAVPGWGLRVVAAIPAAAVLAEMRQEELDDSLLAALIVLGVLALALLISRRIARPIKEIAAVAGEVAAGHLETRAPVRGAAEIAEVAVQLNQMLDVRRQAEETLRHTSQRCQVLSRQLLQIREQERRHIARELHDEIGQALTAVKISLQAMGQPAGAHMQATHKENCIHIVDRALQSVRGLSLDLCPPILDDLGLPAALRWQLDRHARPAGLAVHFSHALDGRPDRDLETACFRIAQEAITNVIRHAEAAEIQVDLCQREAALHLSVCDDGKGFDVRSARQRALAGKSMGLFSMEERVKLLGGRFFLDSAPGRGTDIRAVFPLAAALRGVA